LPYAIVSYVMTVNDDKKARMVVATSATAMFSDLHHLGVQFRQWRKEKSKGATVREYTEALSRYQCEPMHPGVALPFIRKLYQVCRRKGISIKLMLVSRAEMVAFNAVEQSLKHYGMSDAFRSVKFTGGEDPVSHFEGEQPDIFFTTTVKDALKGSEAGICALLVKDIPGSIDELMQVNDNARLKIGCDYDGVIVDQTDEKTYQDVGYEGYREHLRLRSGFPSPPGPFCPFLRKILDLGKDAVKVDIISSRDATTYVGGRIPENLEFVDGFKLSEFDAVYALGGEAKLPTVRQVGYHLFVDDHPDHCESVMNYAPTAQVVSKNSVLETWQELEYATPLLI